MPELPEVETTRRGIEPYLDQQKIIHVAIRQPQLRWPIPTIITERLPGENILAVSRRAKYIIIDCSAGKLLIHLGMSGHLHIVTSDVMPKKHDHFDLVLSSGNILRLQDPRRFGAVLWCDSDIDEYPLLSHLGPEPLSSDFTADYLHGRILRRTSSIKQVIMDGKIVVGVGNIYAAESLYAAKIHPLQPANTLSHIQCQNLVIAIKEILANAIIHGGTTLKDFLKADGKPGYFRNELKVYGRENEACEICNSNLEKLVIGQRTTVFCPVCQPLSP